MEQVFCGFFQLAEGVRPDNHDQRYPVCRILDLGEGEFGSHDMVCSSNGDRRKCQFSNMVEDLD